MPNNAIAEIENDAAVRGLSSSQVAERVAAGLSNVPVETPTKTVGQIIAGNVCTYFNLVFALLALSVVLVGQWQQLMFMPVVFINAGIGIFQELRAKRTLDKLTLLSAPRASAIRDGMEIEVAVSDLVLGDVVVLRGGRQICADAIVLDGEVLVNESLITGEPDEILKSAGAELLSGSYVVSGECHARLERVGADSFASRLTLEVKASRKPVRSEMMRSLSRLVLVIGILLVPIGAGMFYNQYVNLGMELVETVSHTVAALVGMIPEGLYLLTSIALAMSVIRLAKKKTLVHELGCIETLARVNMLCVDKTGTITEPEMQVEAIIPLEDEGLRLSEDRIADILRDHCFNLGDENETMKAIRKHVTLQMSRCSRATHTLPFNSKNKFSAALYEDGSCYLLGAPEFIVRGRYNPAGEYAEQGLRVLMLAVAADMRTLDEVTPIALVTLSNKLRPHAAETFKYFAEQGVAIKVISGDNPETVSCIARKAGIEGAEKWVDASELTTADELTAAATEYNVFGRVTPQQKRELILALKAAGNTVAMTGDGVNDVLALKVADCSVAMASGSEVAAQISHLVLLNNDFASMPGIVAEGRRVINNIGRSAALFLVKNIFSFVFALLTMIAGIAYPVLPNQLSLVSMLTIGVPSFILALEPNVSIVKGHFLRGVLFRATPGAITNILLTLAVVLYAGMFKEFENSSTVCAILLAVTGLAVIFRVCRPFTLLRKLLCIGVAGLLLTAVLLFSPLFSLELITGADTLILCTLGLLSYPLIVAITRVMDKLLHIYDKGIHIWFHK